MLFAMHQHESVLDIHVSPPSWTPLPPHPDLSNYCSWILKFFQVQLSPFIPPFQFSRVLQVGQSLFSSSFLPLGCAVLQVSPVVETPAFSEVTEDCKCDFDDFVIVGEIWKLMGQVMEAPSTTHLMTRITHNMWQCHSGKPLPNQIVSLI